MEDQKKYSVRGTAGRDYNEYSEQELQDMLENPENAGEFAEGVRAIL